ncbi:23S rRNA (guanosine(2251)-2'-O)-methyltransferase RlmB [Brevundimonas sp. NIBR11]|uniref:23S rRNA (guanosine(2251)-2'-O)-methyltransferase RlmB n=1 Tax=Brevundimonas sp. NIBR11 TaxID=3015999 RepID=UPI0022F07D3D|nr:23S rRNA (guanosine(2251)-2'-O)-methyltransferase RlmB [Brevundimonas sp. NIBR11]WGM30808.1 putative tRNA/rRNA methyltransferase [Brevundimonas sp. NIBR11]
MSRNPERNDRKSGKNTPGKTGDRPRKGGAFDPPKGGPDRGGWNPNPPTKGFSTGAPRAGRGKVDADGFLWGRHPVLAALSNPARKGTGRLLATADRAAELERDGVPNGHKIEVIDALALERMLPAGAVHQGLAFKVQPLEGVALEDLAEPAEGIIVMLDQLTDPQNVGAIFRSALAFGARGIVVQDRHSPVLAGALAKAAAGATERLPCARVTNLSRALETLAELGWRAVGLDGSSEETLEGALDHRPTVLVMGSEGDGIRRLVAEHCDVLAKISMPGGFESLNVSNAAAIALYEASRKQRG